MEQFLTQNENKVDAVLSENDGMAGGVVSALAAQGLAGRVPVSGQDGDAAGAEPGRARHCRRSTSGRTRGMLGKAAGESAVQLCGGTTRRPGRPTPSRSRRRAATTLSSILLHAAADQRQDNLNVVLDAGWITKADPVPGRARGQRARSAPSRHSVSRDVPRREASGGAVADSPQSRDDAGHAVARRRDAFRAPPSERPAARSRCCASTRDRHAPARHGRRAGDHLARLPGPVGRRCS